jgi:hypothetical protein
VFIDFLLTMISATIVPAAVQSVSAKKRNYVDWLSDGFSEESASYVAFTASAIPAGLPLAMAAPTMMAAPATRKTLWTERQAVNPIRVGFLPFYLIKRERGPIPFTMENV